MSQASDCEPVESYCELGLIFETTDGKVQERTLVAWNSTSYWMCCRFSELIFRWRIERYTSILNSLADTRTDAIKDRAEVVNDKMNAEKLMSVYKLRIRNLKRFQMAVELRLPKIEVSPQLSRQRSHES